MTNQTRRVLLAAPAVWLCATLLVASQNAAAPAPQPQAPAAAPGASPVIVPANPVEAYKDDVHQQAGVTCASCHSDPTYMRKFRPQVRTDQHAQYVTSVHGQQMVKGETRVATCSDCHNAHGVRPVKDARSPVAPMNVAQTCAKCHADAGRMTPFQRDQAVYDDWSHSVHAAALLQRGDTSAPTCSTCHGSHGATPPGIDSVANICSTCHVREAELYQSSTKRVASEAAEQPACLACHNNHKIVHPQDSWIDLKEPALCATCHTEDMAGAALIRTVRSGFDSLTTKFNAAKAGLDRAEEAGMLVDEGMSALREVTEQQVRLRVAVHAFAEAPFKESLDLGLAAADRAQHAADAAMKELNTRRRGLALATLVILGFPLTLAVKIRHLPPPAST